MNRIQQCCREARAAHATCHYIAVSAVIKRLNSSTEASRKEALKAANCAITALTKDRTPTLTDVEEVLLQNFKKFVELLQPALV